ncbi:hypothetical protein ACFX16_046859 [Malus domestica]
MRNFMWRALRDACANKFNMFRRRCAASPLCPIYAENEETMEHIILLCPWVTNVWKDGSLRIKINRSSITTLADWVCIVGSQNLGNKEVFGKTMEYLAFSFWFIWRARCDAVFNELKPSTSRTTQIIFSALDSFKMASSSLQGSPATRAMSSVWVQASSVLMAEAIAVLEGCLLAKNLHVQEVSWIPRSANMAADFVARFISSEMCGFSWVDRPPSSLVGILNKDGPLCPHS